ncbi:hypothetical protein WA577_001822, partial [Blastocystis sp. JDR]
PFLERYGDSHRDERRHVGKLFHLFLNKQDFKFSSGHFIAYKGFREPLHGHNYHVTVAMKGQLNADGFVMDFGDVKRYTRAECKKLNQHFLLPMKSDVLTITEKGANMEVITEDGCFFSFPKSDCCCLPLVHSSAEELARYIAGELIESITKEVLKERGIYELTIGVSEIEGQEARQWLFHGITHRYTTSIHYD